VQHSKWRITLNLAAITNYRYNRRLQELWAPPQRLRHPRCRPLLVGAVRAAGSAFAPSCHEDLKKLVL